MSKHCIVTVYEHVGFIMRLARKRTLPPFRGIKGTWPGHNSQTVKSSCFFPAFLTVQTLYSALKVACELYTKVGDRWGLNARFFLNKKKVALPYFPGYKPHF